MKENGIVKEYDGYCGTIINEKKEEFLLLKKEIMDEFQLKENDIVSFVPEKVQTLTEDRNVARFVKKLKNNPLNKE